MTVANATSEIAQPRATIYWRACPARQQLALSMRSVVRQLLATTPKAHAQYRQLLNLARETQDNQFILRFLHLVLNPQQPLQVYLTNATLPQAPQSPVQVILRVGGHGLKTACTPLQTLTLVGTLTPLTTRQDAQAPCALEISRVSLTALPLPRAETAGGKLPQEVAFQALFQPVTGSAGAGQQSLFTHEVRERLRNSAQFTTITDKFVQCERILLGLQTQLDNFGVASLRYLAWDYQPRNHSLQFLVVGHNVRELQEQVDLFGTRNVHLRALPDEHQAPAQLSCGAQGINLAQGVAFAGMGKLDKPKFVLLTSTANLAAQGYMPPLVNLGKEFLNFTDINELSTLRVKLQQHFTQPLEYRHTYNEYTTQERAYDGLLSRIPQGNYALGILEVPLSAEFVEQHLSDWEFKIPPTTMKQEDLIRTSREIMAGSSLPFHDVPHAGFLVNVAGQRVPRLVTQERNLRSLWDVSQSANPYLHRYFGDVQQAASALEETIQRVAPQAFKLNLDHAQQNAVQRIINAPQVSVITGAPGTGKTRVAAEALLQLVARGKRVLLTGATVASVDGVLAQLPAQAELRVLRLYDDQLARQNPREIRRLVDLEQLTPGVAHSVGASSVEHYYRVQRDNLQQRLAQQRALADLDQGINQLAEHGKLLHSPAFAQAQAHLEQLHEQQREQQSEFTRCTEKLTYLQSRLDQTFRLDHELVHYTSTARDALHAYWTGQRDNLEDLVIFDNGGHYFQFWEVYARGSELGLRNFKLITADNFRNSDVNQRWSMFQQARTQWQAVRQHCQELTELLNELNPQRCPIHTPASDWDTHNPLQSPDVDEEFASAWDDPLASDYQDWSSVEQDTPPARNYEGDPFLGIELEGARNEDFTTNYGVTGNYADCHAEPNQRTLTVADPFLEFENLGSGTGNTRTTSAPFSTGAEGGNPQDIAHELAQLTPAQLVARRQEQLLDWQRRNLAGEFDMELASAITKEKQRLRLDAAFVPLELVAHNYRPGSFTIEDGQVIHGDSHTARVSQLQQYVQRLGFVVLRNWRDWSLAQLEQYLEQLWGQLSVWEQELFAALQASTENFGKAQNRYNNEQIAELQTKLQQLNTDLAQTKQDIIAQQQELLRLQQADDYLADPQAHFLNQLHLYLRKYQVTQQFASLEQLQQDRHYQKIVDVIRKDAQHLHSVPGQLQAELCDVWAEILADEADLPLFATQNWAQEDFAQVYTQQAQVLAVPLEQLAQLRPDQGGFDVVLVDNAQQIPLLELPPIMHQAPQVVLLGDPWQQPGQLAARDNAQYTLFSIVDQFYESHFERMTDLLENYNGKQMNQLVQTSWLQQFVDYGRSSSRLTLGQQYRMHPSIAQMLNLGYGEQARSYQPRVLESTPTHRAWINQQGEVLLQRDTALVWVDTSKLDLREVRTPMPASQFSERALVGYCLQELHKDEVEQRLVLLDQQLSRALQEQVPQQPEQLRAQLEAQLPRKRVAVLGWSQRHLDDIQRDLKNFDLSKFSLEFLMIPESVGREFDIVLVTTANAHFQDTTQQFAHGMETLLRYEWLNLACSRARDFLMVFAPCVQHLHTPVEVPMSYNFAQPEVVHDKQIHVYQHFYQYCTNDSQAQWLTQAQLATYFAQQVQDHPATQVSSAS